MIDYFERERFIQLHGEPLVETHEYRFYLINHELRVFDKETRTWTTGYRSEYGDIHVGRMWVGQEVQEEIDSLIAEHILLEVEDETKRDKIR